MKTKLYKNISLGLILACFLISCEDFLEVDAPHHKMGSEVVFDNDETAISAMNGIYNQLFTSNYINGSESSITILAGLSSDNLDGIRGDRDLVLHEFDEHEILPDNTSNLSLWSSAYNIIYLTNSVLEGIQNSGQLSEVVHNTLEGEAKFIRAFTYFYLVNLYGEVPHILTTDYRHNSMAEQIEQEQVYQQILLDLTDATNLLGDEYREGDRKHVNRFAAIALMARVNLYLENWEETERLSSLVLSNTNNYELKDDLNDTFLANSKEAIWQISPIGRGNILTFTWEAYALVVDPIFPTLSKFSLTNELTDSFENNDKRFLNWTGYHEGTNNHYAFKYKDRSSMEDITEYSMVLRLAEQYLIRSEARARLNDTAGALADLDAIRKRAGLSLLSEQNLQIGQDELLEHIIEERRKELFTEWGHRWLDLKRTGKASEVLGVDNVLYPIPEEELMKNPNLNQNPGY